MKPASPRPWAVLMAVSWTLALALAVSGESLSREDLWRGAHEGDLAVVKAALEAGVEIDAPKRYGATALLMAAGAGNEEIVRLLLDQGAEVEVSESFWGTTPLARALQGQHLEIAKLLLDHGATFGSQVFYQALFPQDPALIEQMLEKRDLYAFERDDAVAIVRFMGPKETLERLESAAVIDGAPVVSLPRTALEHYVGAFGREGTEQTSFEVVLRDGVLTLLGGAAPAPLSALNARHFRAGENLETGVFFLARAGVVDGFLLMQRGLPPVEMRRFEDSGHDVSRSTPSDEREHALAPRSADRAWPSFRGAGARGVADGQGAVVDWNLESGHHVLWSAEVPGLGLSSPVVADGRVFLTTAVSEGDQGIKTGTYGDPSSVADVSVQDWRVIAFEQGNGEVLWQTSVAVEEPGAKRHLKSSHANSTPATDGERVVAVFPTAGLVALGAEKGEVLWRHRLGALSSGTSDGIFQWGFASSPILWRQLVILQVDAHDDSYIAAWDLETGEARWRTQRDEIPTWSTPAILEHDEHLELIAAGTTNRAYDPRDGRELWRLGPNSEVVVATPVVGDGVVFLTSGYPPIRPIYSVAAGSRGDLTLPAGESSSQAVSWSHRRGGGYMPTPILYRGLLYMPHHNGRLVAYDAASGEIVYRARLSQRGTLTGSPIAGDGRLYFPTEEGLVYVVEAGRTYRELAVNEMDSGVMSTPALSGGRLFIRSLERLWALGRPQSPVDSASE